MFTERLSDERTAHFRPERSDRKAFRCITGSKVVSDSQLIRTEPIPDLGAGIGLVASWESD